MNLRRIFLLAAGVLLVEVAIAAWGLWQVGPSATVPIHWDASGTPNGYGSALFAFLIVPGMTIVVAGVLAAIPAVEPRRDNLRRSGNAYRTVMAAVTVFMLGIQLMVVLLGTGHDAPMAVVVGGGIGLLFAAIGNVMTTVRSNFMFGVRTPWTLSSERSWDKTHRLVGRLFVVAGIVIFAASLFGKLVVEVWLLVGFSVVILIVASGYSYLVWRGDPDRRPSPGAW